jgi:glucosamine--fructose-6-phosphate aminotransferase (isomerizing)
MNSVTTSQMQLEIAEIPDVVSRQISEGSRFYREEGIRLQVDAPRFLATCARGSSDHAATYFKYLVETRMGIPVASLGPSIASIYDTDLKLGNGVLVTVSQSGGSPDLVRLQQRAAAGGARTVALLNVTESPVGECAMNVLPMLAGPERAVAATKSFVASLVALASILAHWSGDKLLIEALSSLPERLASALKCDWSAAGVPLAAAYSLFTIARGPGLGVAGEAALKLKETCGLHAEAYSAAEVRHGPIVLANRRFVGLVFANGDESDASVREAANILTNAGANVFVAGTSTSGAQALKTVSAEHSLLNPICQIVSLYQLIERLSVALGKNPDAPPLLAKVTETI